MIRGEGAVSDFQNLQDWLDQASPAALQRLAADPVAAEISAELAKQPARQKPLLRSVHHFACTGGTLISKCIAAMPATRLLSEVDPFSDLTHRQSFLPTDLIGLSKKSSAPLSRDGQERIFMAGLAALAAETRAEGRDLILRDHTHGHYCYGEARRARPPLQVLLGKDYRLLSLVTVRHPLDSYISLVRQKWTHFEPANLEEYARRYLLFLDDYAGTDLLRHAIGGLIETMADLTLVFAPHLNSYRRLRAGSLAPTQAAWGYENRTAAILVPGGPSAARRIEHRVAGADANPYLVLAAILGAAERGIGEAKQPPAPVSGNAYREAAPKLARDWLSATDRFETSELAKLILHPELVETFVACKRQEQEVFAGRISPFEFATYRVSV